jgi:hypothetical protein
MRRRFKDEVTEYYYANDVYRTPNILPMQTKSSSEKCKHRSHAVYDDDRHGSIIVIALNNIVIID